MNMIEKECIQKEKRFFFFFFTRRRDSNPHHTPHNAYNADVLPTGPPDLSKRKFFKTTPLTKVVSTWSWIEAVVKMKKV